MQRKNGRIVFVNFSIQKQPAPEVPLFLHIQFSSYGNFDGIKN